MMMDIVEEKQEGVVVLKVAEDRIDAACAAAFRDAVAAVIARGEGRLVIDLAAVTFMDSTGLGALVATLKTAGGGRIALCGVRDSVATLFKLTRMDKVFRIFPTRPAAAAALAKDGV
jgi:anti-sigma B factor antagonist